jgi:predicted Rossmann-fold nucleotide-binding protein
MEAVFRGAQNSGSKLTTKTVGILPGHDAEAANDYADVGDSCPDDLLRVRPFFGMQSLSK